MPCDWRPYKNVEQRHTWNKHHVTREAETEMMQLQDKGGQGLMGAPEAERKAWDRLSPRVSRELGSTDTLTLHV